MSYIENGRRPERLEEQSTSAVSSLIRWAAPVAGVTLLTSATAMIYIPLPFTPVPITMQLFMVLLGGAILGQTRGSISQVLYVIWGVSGAPFFAGGALGLAAIAGPTGGYLVGFIPAAFLAGWLVPKAKNTLQRWLAFFAASLVVLMLGVMHLSMFTAHNLIHAFELGLIPFLPGDVIKVSLATAAYEAWKHFRK